MTKRVQHLKDNKDELLDKCNFNVYMDYVDKMIENLDYRIELNEFAFANMHGMDDTKRYFFRRTQLKRQVLNI